MVSQIHSPRLVRGPPKSAIIAASRSTKATTIRTAPIKRLVPGLGTNIIPTVYSMNEETIRLAAGPLVYPWVFCVYDSIYIRTIPRRLVHWDSFQTTIADLKRVGRSRAVIDIS